MNWLHSAGSLEERAILVLIEDGERPRVLATTAEEQHRPKYKRPNALTLYGQQLSRWPLLWQPLALFSAGSRRKAVCEREQGA